MAEQEAQEAERPYVGPTEIAVFPVGMNIVLRVVSSDSGETLAQMTFPLALAKHVGMSLITAAMLTEGAATAEAAQAAASGQMN